MTFREKVLMYIAEVPYGKVCTYSQLASLAGNPQAARRVGSIAHYGPQELPWHRLVMKSGSMATGYPGGIVEQAKALKSEAVVVDTNLAIDLKKYIYNFERKLKSNNNNKRVHGVK